MPDTAKDFVLAQQKDLLAGWSLPSELHVSPVVDKALKALNAERLKAAKIKLNNSLATGLALQLDALQAENATKRRKVNKRMADEGKVSVDIEQPAWMLQLAPEWPNARSKSAAKRYKELLARVKELHKQREKLVAQRATYQALNARLTACTPQEVADIVPTSASAIDPKLDTLLHLLQQNGSQGDEANEEEMSEAG